VATKGGGESISGYRYTCVNCNKNFVSKWVRKSKNVYCTHKCYVEVAGSKFKKWQKENPDKEKERREKIRKAHLGRTFTVEHRRNLSIAKKELIKSGKFKTPRSTLGLKFKDWSKKRGNCERCNKYGMIETHHIDFNHKNRNKNNLLNICRGCHLKIHRRYAFANLDIEVKRDKNGRFEKDWRYSMKTDKSGYDNLKGDC